MEFDHTLRTYLSLLESCPTNSSNPRITKLTPSSYITGACWRKDWLWTLRVKGDQKWPSPVSGPRSFVFPPVNHWVIYKLIISQAIESAATGPMTRTDPTSLSDLRNPTIYSDAILAMLKAPAKTVNGLLELDEDFLRNYTGVTEFSKYSLVEGANPRRIMPAKFPDLTVAEQADEGRRTDSTKLRAAKLWKAVT